MNIRARSKRAWLAAITAGAMAVALAGCAGGDSGGSEPDKSGELTTVRVGNLVYTGTAPFQLGIKKGFFEEEGLKIEQVEGDNPAAIAGQITSGQLDIGFATTTFLATVVAQGAPLKAIAAVEGLIDTKAPVSAIVVPADSPIKSPKDLSGKKVAVVALGSELHLITLVVVDEDGGDSKTVQPVQLPFPQMQQALEAGNVDAIVTTEPFLTATLSTGARDISDPEIDVFPNGSVSAWIASDSFIKSNPKAVAAFKRAMDKTLQYSSDHKDEVLALIPDYAGLEKSQLENMNLGTVYNPKLDNDSIVKMAELLHKYGFIDKAPTLEQLVYTPKE